MNEAKKVILKVRSKSFYSVWQLFYSENLDLIILTKSLDVEEFMLVATGCLLISHAPGIFVCKIKSLFSSKRWKMLV